MGKRWDSETWDRNISVDVLENSNPQAGMQRTCLEMGIEGGLDRGVEAEYKAEWEFIDMHNLPMI